MEATTGATILRERISFFLYFFFFFQRYATDAHLKN